ncbi:hypothetical protein RND71_001771 [Anisodus tanguticus]|uniref:Uncharacterized protein n=1 Tax=Anisodus tanguticus TaxID=243964 RepID=A0AAE1T1J8_9SOLA|nr:hypothetical protein RND71_001771 [Anisodus tanguticus]
MESLQNLEKTHPLFILFNPRILRPSPFFLNFEFQTEKFLGEAAETPQSWL